MEEETQKSEEVKDSETGLEKKSPIVPIVAVIVLLLIVGTGIYYSKTKTSTNETELPVNNLTDGQTPGDSTESVKVTGLDVNMTEGMKIEDLNVGTGTEAVDGKMVVVDYVGTLTDGTQFDSSKEFGKPFAFTLGKGEVIEGWDQGVAGMKVGGKRKLTIPPELGYGSQAVGTIPANSTLIFEVELLEVK